MPGVGVLVFKWDAIARLISELGPDWEQKIARVPANHDLSTLAVAVAVGTGKSYDEIMELSPPIFPTITATVAALNLAFHGKRESPQVAAENPPRPKTLRRLISWLTSLSGRRARA